MYLSELKLFVFVNCNMIQQRETQKILSKQIQSMLVSHELLSHSHHAEHLTLLTVHGILGKIPTKYSLSEILL